MRLQQSGPADPNEEAMKARQGVKENVVLFGLTVAIIRAVPYVLDMLR